MRRMDVNKASTSRQQGVNKSSTRRQQVVNKALPEQTACCVLGGVRTSHASSNPRKEEVECGEALLVFSPPERRRVEGKELQRQEDGQRRGKPLTAERRLRRFRDAANVFMDSETRIGLRTFALSFLR
ncbi:hypothetical protein EYF80_059189 [Liparis tanakae]|uniref:Uncharacterized protein n=1 Tax=Liparis tanakae TaxID=230148 RepID=A0A4Z2EPF4_9TELE|nr:hypothetical protein EYF80_059189 [Liparis tanakae]